jgi:tetratricopeptide (TPR) repeat protein
MRSGHANPGNRFLVIAGLLLLAALAASLPGQELADSITIHQRAARQAEARQNFQIVIAEQQVLTRMLPRNAELQSNLGVALYFHRDFKKAAATCRRAIALNRNLDAPDLFRGLAMAQLAQPDAAVAELEKAVVLKGDDLPVRTWLVN